MKIFDHNSGAVILGNIFNISYNWQFEAKRSLPLITSSFDEDELFPIVNGNY